jgi:hypothetical protein
MDDRRSTAMTDEALDRDLAAALSVDPSPQFVARVRTRIAAEPAPSSLWRWRMVASTGAAVAIAAAVVIVAVRPAGAPPAVVLPAGHDLVLLAPPMVAPVVPPAAVPAAPVPRTAPRVAPPPAAGIEVLISGDERRAFALLVRSIEEGRLSSAAIPAAGAGEATVPSIEIPPLDTTPLREIAQLGGGLP